MLIILVLVELAIGYIFLHKIHQKILAQKTQQQINQVMTIDQTNLVFPNLDEFKYYWELKPNTEVVTEPSWLGHKVVNTHNADGLNERFNYEVEKPTNTFRIVTLGDSFTYGANVNTEDNWSEQLEDLLNQHQPIMHKNKYEVINCGMYGFDIPYSIKRYQDLGAKYQPDLIIWFESGSGFNRMNEIEQAITEQCFKEYETNNIQADDQAIHPCHLRTDDYMFKNFFRDSSDEVLNKLMDKLNTFLNTIDQKQILFFSFTKDSIYSAHLLEPAIQKIHQQHPDVKYLPIVDESNYKNTRLADEHPSEFGHQIIAETIFEYLKNNYE